MKNIFALQKINIKSALRQISISGQKCLIIIDKKKKILGTLSDGDLRRAILKGKKLNSSIKNIYKKEPFTLVESSINSDNLKKIFLNKKLDLIPVINNKKEVVKVLYLKDVFKNLNSKVIKNNIYTVIMAGGIGSRLEPFTNVLPKALVPVQNKPVINHIISKFCAYNYNKFYIILNYKAKILRAYFDENKENIFLRFLEEKSPLGTASSLSLLKNKIKEPFFLSNCDIIVNINYNDLYKFHEEKKYKFTIVVSTKQITIPYGSCKLNSDGSLRRIFEKPEYNFLANVGLYVMSPEIINYIPLNQRFDITDLLEILKKKKIKVGVFPIDEGSWVDVGQWEEYRKTLNYIDRK